MRRAHGVQVLVLGAQLAFLSGISLGHPTEIVIRKSHPGSGAGQDVGASGASIGRMPAAGQNPQAGSASTAGEGPLRRIAFPHHLIAPGFTPDRSISSASRRASARLDVFSRMRANAAARRARGAPAFAPDVQTSVPGQDTVRIAMLRVDFLTDRGGPASSGNGRFELDPPDPLNRPFDPTPHDKRFFESHAEALRRYYRDQTAGRTVFEFTVYPSGRDTAFHITDMANYGPWKFSPDIYPTAAKLFKDCIVAADTSESIPWGQFDRVCIIHAGSDLQSDVNQDSPSDIPTFTIGVADTDAVAVGPAKADTIFSSVIAPETIRQDGYEGVINAVLAHEFGHLVYGYRDVYSVTSGLPTVGYWNLMDTGNLLGNALPLGNGGVAYVIGILPPSIDPWQKRLVYEDVPSARFPNYGQEESLTNSSEGYEVLRVPLSGEEYYLIENRLDDLNGNGSITLQRDQETGVILGPAAVDTLEYDHLEPGPGALVWHVDESVADFFGPRADPGYGLNTNPGRFGLQIIEADGLDDLGDFNSPYALGAYTDPWSSTTGGRLNFDTIPKLRSNSRTNPHLDIEFTSPPGTTQSLRVTRLWDLPGWPVRVVQPPEGISPIVTPLGGRPEPRIAWTGGDSAVHVRNRDGTPLSGGANDIVYRATNALGPVAAVHEISGLRRSWLAVSNRTPAGQSGGRITIVQIDESDVVTLTHVDLPAAITAGPACAPPVAPSVATTSFVFVGLADGQVIYVPIDAAVGAPVVVGQMTGAVNGLAVEADLVVATSDQGKLWSAATGELDTFAPGHVQQPILFRILPPGAPPVGPPNEIGVVDRTAGAFGVYGPGDQGEPPAFRSSQSRPLGEAIGPPALDDFDGDGLPEVGFLSVSGRMGYWNTNGSLSPGWPPEVELEGFVCRAGPVALRMQDAGSAPLLLAPLGNGVLAALNSDQKNAPGFPLGLSVGARGTPAIDDSAVPVDGPPLLFVAGGDTLLYGFSVASPGGRPGGSDWSHEGGSAGRAFASRVHFSSTVGGSATPILPGSLVCYPNPARQKPVTFAFRLNEPGRVSIRIFDSSAHEVDRLERDASASDNALVWDPAGRKSGLYVARIEIAGQVLTQPFAIVR